LLDVLQATNSDYLQLRDATFYGLGAKSHSVFLPDCTLLKSQTVLAIPKNERHESPENRLHAFKGKKHHSALILLPGYNVAGCLHLKGTSNAVSALTSEFGAFVPVTEATVRPSFDLATQFEASTVIVNKSLISMFAIGESMPTAATVRQPEASARPVATSPAADHVDERVYELVRELQQLIGQRDHAAVPAHEAATVFQA
jgi:hypothetical protein